jgi:IPTL-CTERM motif/Putative Ig domain
MAVMAAMGWIDLAQAATVPATVAADSFSYTANVTLTGQSGGTGWSGPWFSHSSSFTDFRTNGTSLAVPGLTSAGGKFVYAAGSGLNDSARSLPLQNSGVVYVQFLSQFGTQSGGGTPSVRFLSSGPAQFWIGNNGACGAAVYAILDPSAGGPAPGNPACSNVLLSQLRAVVVRVDYTAGNTKMWLLSSLIGFDYLNPPAPSATYAGLAVAFDTLAFYARTPASIDELRIFRLDASFSPATQTVSALAGTAITPTATLADTNLSGTVTFGVTPTLPTGLVLNTGTGVISGTPAATQISTTYTITGTGSTAGSATAAVAIAVASPHGVCGTAAGQRLVAAPTANLCTTGTASAVGSTAGQYAWTCAGLPGGTTASCTASWASVPGGAQSGTIMVPASGNNNWALAGGGSFVSATSVATAPPAGTVFPFGLAAFQLTGGAAGSTARLTIHYTDAVPVGAVYMKYGRSPDGYSCTGAACQVDHWYTLPDSVAVFAPDRLSVALTLTDGGLGDSDAIASQITDPGGPALLAATGLQGIPTLSEWGLILLSAVLALAGFLKLRHPISRSGRPCTDT